MVCALAACGRVGFDEIDASTLGRDCGDVPGLIFCEGFEDPMFRAWSMGSVTVDGQLMSVDDVVYSGTRALRVETMALNGYAYLGTVTQLVDDGDYWLRMYVRFPQLVPLMHLDLATVAANSVAGAVLYVENDSPYAWLEEPRTFLPTTTIIGRDRWTCLELRLVIADAVGSVEIFVDGSPAGTFTNLDTHPPLGYSALRVGMPASEQVGTQVYIDDVIASRLRASCD